MRHKPKKSLGQNFLIDKNVQRKIIQACAFSPQDVVLEIGSGRGEFTRLIAEKVSAFYALEIDSSLCETLKDEFKNYKNMHIICDDFLRFDIQSYFSGHQGKIKIFGNIPYYITSPIIEKIFSSKDKIETVFLTVQKEFAERIVALPGSKNYGSFSCFVQYYAQTQKFFAIKKNSFYPAPKVDSCFIKLLIREKPPVQIKDETHLFKIIRSAFNQRRKTLRNSLKKILAKEIVESFLNSRGFPLNIRPERLSLKDFAEMLDYGAPRLYKQR